MNKSYLDIEVIWKDPHLCEIQISASNKSFTGKTQVYDIGESLLEFSKALINYPTEKSDLFYEAGKKDGYSYFSMKFYQFEMGGKTGVEINLEKNVSGERLETKDKLKLEILVELAAIDNFQKELFQLAKNEEGKATLFGY